MFQTCVCRTIGKLCQISVIRFKMYFQMSTHSSSLPFFANIHLSSSNKNLSVLLASGVRYMIKVIDTIRFRVSRPTRSLSLHGNTALRGTRLFRRTVQIIPGPLCRRQGLGGHRCDPDIGTQAGGDEGQERHSGRRHLPAARTTMGTSAA